MPTIPYFLSSRFGRNVSADGSSFDVPLENPIAVPAGKKAYAYIHSADVPYVMYNCSALKNNNTLLLGAHHAATDDWHFENPPVPTYEEISGTIAPPAGVTYHPAYAGKYRHVSSAGVNSDFTLVVTRTELDGADTPATFRDTINTLATAAMHAAHPTLVAETVLVLSASHAADPLLFYNVISGSSVAVATNTTRATLTRKTPITITRHTDGGETYAAELADHRGLAHGAAYFTTATDAYANIELLYKNPFHYDSKSAAFMYSQQLTGGKEVIKGMFVVKNLSVITPRFFWSVNHNTTVYRTATIPDGLYDVVSLNNALQTQVATLAETCSAFAGTDRFKLEPDFDQNRVRLVIAKAGDAVLFRNSITATSKMATWAIDDTNDAFWWFDYPEWSLADAFADHTGAASPSKYLYYKLAHLPHATYDDIEELRRRINDAVHERRRHDGFPGVGTVPAYYTTMNHVALADVYDPDYGGYVMKLAVAKGGLGMVATYSVADFETVHSVTSPSVIDFDGAMAAHWTGTPGTGEYADPATLVTTLQGALYVGVEGPGFTTYEQTVPGVALDIGHGIAELLGYVHAAYAKGSVARYDNQVATADAHAFIASQPARIDETTTLILGTDLCQGAVFTNGSSGHHGMANFPASTVQIGAHISFMPEQLIKIRAQIDGLRIPSFRVFLTNGHGDPVEMGDEVYALTLIIQYDD